MPLNLDHIEALAQRVLTLAAESTCPLDETGAGLDALNAFESAATPSTILRLVAIARAAVELAKHDAQEFDCVTKAQHDALCELLNAVDALTGAP